MSSTARPSTRKMIRLLRHHKNQHFKQAPVHQRWLAVDGLKIKGGYQRKSVADSLRFVRKNWDRKKHLKYLIDNFGGGYGNPVKKRK